MKTIQLVWKKGTPTVTGWYLCAHPGNQSLTTMFVTKKDIQLVKGELPEWLGPEDTLWAGPISSPFKE